MATGTGAEQERGREAETRGFVRLRGLAVVLTVGGSLVTVLALAVIEMALWTSTSAVSLKRVDG